VALDQFHREKVDPIGLLDRIDRDDVRVVESGEGTGFALEAREAEPLQGARSTPLANTLHAGSHAFTSGGDGHVNSR
jgi:hypothetical protein